MWSYLLRRILYAIPILITINVFTFVLFFCVNTPENVARNKLGEKNVKPEMVYTWKKEHFYHYPTFLNQQDKIYYFCELHAEKSFLKELDSYETQTIEISEKTTEPELTESLKKIKDGVNGNSIFIINPLGLKKETVDYIKNQFLSFGLPYVLVQTSTTAINEYASSIVPVLYQDKIKPYCDSVQAKGFERFTHTLFYEKAVQLFWFQFGKSDQNNLEIKDEILTRMWPSLIITVPTFIFGLLLNIGISMIIAYCRGSLIDRATLFICILLMSLVSLFYIVIAQYLFGFVWKIFPASGYQEGFDAMRFALLPILIALVSGLGGGVRFYRTLFLEEINKDFVRTARSKGLSEFSVLFKHTLKCAMIPILTGVVTAIPTLFTGSLLMENFFGIPGLGAFTIEGLDGKDFRIVGSMVYLGAFMHVIALILTDIAYTMVDPRVKLK